MIGVTWVSKNSCQERGGDDTGAIVDVEEDMQ